MTAKHQFNPLSEEALAFEETPGEFVHLERMPIVFTVRGIRLFAPRFDTIGVKLVDLRTADEFNTAKAAWDAVEMEYLRERIAAGRTIGKAADPYKALHAVLEGDADGFEAAISALEHRQRVALSVVKKSEAP